MYDRVQRSPQTRGAVAALNEGLIRLTRILTPLNYTRSGRFDHDPAVGLGPFPLLAPAAELARLEPGSPAYHQTLTALVRCRNAVGMALREALEVVRAAIGAADTTVAAAH